ncbi:hypothetical protein H5410_024314 [Solanum commersonii]|uniref:Uncharacterized protein n=1 Tax=Solanum commersonii TaxID=4109 RepID=A0A9J5ZLL4_SOLCO|nr:hypothetical protein H5410_024314 [Solanum commersonii]
MAAVTLRWISWMELVDFGNCLMGVFKSIVYRLFLKRNPSLKMKMNKIEQKWVILLGGSGRIELKLARVKSNNKTKLRSWWILVVFEKEPKFKDEDEQDRTKMGYIIRWVGSDRVKIG